MRRADRLFQIVQKLRRRGVTTARSLAEALEVSERTIYRDVQDLVASGVPIQGEAGVGYALPRGFDLPPLMFTEEELEALVLGARMVEGRADSDLAMAARSLLDKVEAVLPQRLKGKTTEASLYAPSFHLPERDDDPLRLLRQAIRARQRVRFGYTDKKASASLRTVRPLGLFYWGPSWSLAAWCELRQDFRSFRVDRLQGLVALEGAFSPEPGQSLADMMARIEREDAEAATRERRGSPR
jgi:predicted DNA-binding transcriptional regulator YafY